MPDIPATRTPTAAPDIPTPMLRLISKNPSIALRMPDRNMRAMADELLTHRADAKPAAATAADREQRKTDAITDALIANFTITGNPRETWRISTISAVLIDELRAAGWQDITLAEIQDLIRVLDANPTIPLTLDTTGPAPVLHGLAAQGAAV